MYNMFATGQIDLALIVTLGFVGFFIALVMYLRREDRREGYPLEDDVTGRLEAPAGLFFTAKPKTFILSTGEKVTVPNSFRESQEVNGRRTSRVPGSPLEPIGDPMLAAVGPGSYAQRAKKAELMLDGEPKIVPIRVASSFFVERKDVNPVGLNVLGADGEVAGVVSDLWVDRGEGLIRYIEVAVKGSGKRVMAPMPMVIVDKKARVIKVQALLASQFENAPALENPNEITLDEEERVSAYFGAGTLYATPDRLEPWL